MPDVIEARCHKLTTEVGAISGRQTTEVRGMEYEGALTIFTNGSRVERHSYRCTTCSEVLQYDRAEKETR